MASGYRLKNGSSVAFMDVAAPVVAPTRTAPATAPIVQPARYDPDRDHCPGQRVRTVRRIRRLIEP